MISAALPTKSPVIRGALQYYPHYVITSAAEDITKEDLCIALRTAKLNFVADNLHETWQTPCRSNIKYLEQIEEWHATALYKKDPTSFLIIGDPAK